MKKIVNNIIPFEGFIAITIYPFMYERDFDYLKNRRPFAWLCPPSKKA